MGYLALYRKYRPENFDDVVGQDKVIKVISNAVLNNKISHAYLFSGPRGTGKTTTAKIIARMVNCTNLYNGIPCGLCENCKNFSSNSDVVEIDAASNNGVDEIRELRDKVNLVPTNSKYKIYIIDEVHMLTTQAFNALLKTLEEPPSHVIFILATTEPHKIPLTVASRCQKFQFTKIDDNEIVKKLNKISELENIDISNDALFEIARLSDGGLRDAINLLDQLTAYKEGNITLEDVYKVNGSVSYVELYNLLNYIKSNSSDLIIEFIENIDKNGKNISKFIEEMIIFLKDVLIFKSTGRKTKIEEKNTKIVEVSKEYDDKLIYNLITEMNDLLGKIKVASYPSILFIVSLLKMSSVNINIEGNYNKENIVKKEITEMNGNTEIISREIISVKEEHVTNNVEVDAEIRKIKINNTFSSASKELLNEVKLLWNSISEYVLDKKYELAAGLLTDTVPAVVGEKNMILVSKYDASAIRINANIHEIENLLDEIYKKKYSIIAISNDEWNVEKNKYIDNLKKGYKYTYIEEINYNNNKREEIKEDSPVDELINLLGEELIEFK